MGNWTLHRSRFNLRRLCRRLRLPKKRQQELNDEDDIKKKSLTKQSVNLQQVLEGADLRQW